MSISRDEAWKILHEYTHSPALVRHALAVEAAMRHYAPFYRGDVERWGIVGLLHDFDYERWPDEETHTQEGARVLRGLGVEEEIVEAILSHVPWNADRYPRDTPLRRVLYAVDEACGFIVAAALVRPGRLVGLQPRSVIKKLKQRSFAAAVSREDIQAGSELLGLELAEHLQHCIDALTAVAGELNLLPE